MTIEKITAIRMTLDERQELDDAINILSQFSAIYTNNIVAEPTDPLSLTLNDIIEILESADYCTVF